jgi:hypothetical protein
VIDKPKGARDVGVKMGCVPCDQGVCVAGRGGISGSRPNEGVSQSPHASGKGAVLQKMTKSFGRGC